MKTGTTSFRELFDGGRSIQIPVIQRDYAQGRQDEASREVRRRFVDALYGALSSDRAEGAPLDLDFVYGRWVPGTEVLEPLDGQQRLTTLFLLHWYLAHLADAFGEFRSWIVLPNRTLQIELRPTKLDAKLTARFPDWRTETETLVRAVAFAEAESAIIEVGAVLASLD